MKLAPRERACLVLRYYEDLKVADIAETLEISDGAVKRYLSDGLAKLSVALVDDADATGTRPSEAGLSITGSSGGAHHANRR